MWIDLVGAFVQKIPMSVFKKEKWQFLAVYCVSESPSHYLLKIYANATTTSTANANAANTNMYL